MQDYQKEYQRWMAAELEDFDLKRELQCMAGQEEEIKEHFARALEFGTAGIRGTLGAGTNRMNIFVVRQATEGLARYILEEKLEKLVAISYDAGAGPVLCYQILSLQRGHYADCFPQPCRVQRL